VNPFRLLDAAIRMAKELLNRIFLRGEKTLVIK
jgi:hypothetical protein